MSSLRASEMQRPGCLLRVACVGQLDCLLSSTENQAYKYGPMKPSSEVFLPGFLLQAEGLAGWPLGVLPGLSGSLPAVLVPHPQQRAHRTSKRFVPAECPVDSKRQRERRRERSAPQSPAWSRLLDGRGPRARPFQVKPHLGNKPGGGRHPAVPLHGGWGA